MMKGGKRQKIETHLKKNVRIRERSSYGSPADYKAYKCGELGRMRDLQQQVRVLILALH